MVLSAPLYRLKHKAKQLAREAGQPLHQALNRIARDEGFQNWSLLVARHSGNNIAPPILASLVPGDLFLLAARPGQGKTLTALQLIIETIRRGGRGVFYTLDDTKQDVSKRLQFLGTDDSSLGDAFTCDTSNAISATYIMDQLKTTRRGTLVAIDYLQLLDQDRRKPELSAQIAALQAFARDTGLILVILSQIDRTYDPLCKTLPDRSDIRLPNPLDLTLFSKMGFLHGGQYEVTTVA